MTVTKSIPTDRLRELDVHRGDTIRVPEAHEENIPIEIQGAESAKPSAGQASEWLRTARGSVRLAPNESADDARMVYYEARYGAAT